MKTTLYLGLLMLVSIVFTQSMFAGPLVEKHRTEQASAIAGALTAQMVMRPFNPAGPFVDHYFQQYIDNKGQVTTPAAPSDLTYLKARLLWEYGPLSGRALQFSENLNHTVIAMMRENPSLLESSLLNGPSELKERIAQKILELQNREKSFKGFQAEGEEASYSGLRLTKTKPDNRQAGTFDLYDPSTGKSYQSKVFATASDSLKGLREDYEDMLAKVPDKAKYFNGMIPKDQIDELVAKGNLKVLSEKTQYGGKYVVEYMDTETGIKLIAHESQISGERFYKNVRRSYTLQKQLTARPAGFGNAAVGGFIVGSGISVAAQIYKGQDVNWTSVAESGGIGLASGATTVILAQQIEQRFGKELAQRALAIGLSEQLARGLSGGLASFGVGAVVVEGFVLHDYLTDQITSSEAIIQSGIGLGSVGVGVGASMIAAWATAGTLAGSEVPVIGNAAGFLVGLAAGTVAYVGGEWYYENFKLEGIHAEMVAFKKASAKWDAEKVDTEIMSLHETASTLRLQAAKTFQ